MTEKQIKIINSILYYVVAPILVLEFILTDLKIIQFTAVLFGGSIGVLVILGAIVFFYKKKHPEYDYKVNDLYSKILVVIILMECFYTAGFFN